MKTSILLITITAMSLITIGTLIFPSGYPAWKAERHGAAAISSCQPGADIPASSYNEVMNTLFTASGR